MTECPKCVDGWIGNDQCRECDGLGEVEEDPFYIAADRLYEDLKDRELDD